MGKLEKSSSHLKEKIAHSEHLQKKVDDLTKQQEKLKSQTKSSVELELAKQELFSARAQLSTLQSEKMTFTATAEQLKTDRKAYKTKCVELTTTLSSMKEEWSSREAKYKEESKELAKRLVQQQEKAKAQKEDFTSRCQSLNAEVSRFQNEVESEKASFESQKQAYLARINQLETDLEITERGLLEKDRQIDSVRESSIVLESEISKVKELAHDYQHKLQLLSKEKSAVESQLKKVMAELEKVLAEKDSEQAHFESLVVSLQSTIDQYQADHESSTSCHAQEIETKNATIQSLKDQLRVADQELKLMSNNLTEKESELGEMAVKQQRLATQHESYGHAASKQIQDLEAVIQQSRTDFLQLEKDLAERIESKQVEIETLNAKLAEQSSLVKKYQSDKSDLHNRLIELQQSLQDLQDGSDSQVSLLQRQLSECREQIRILDVEKDELVNEKDSLVVNHRLSASELEQTIRQLEQAASQSQLDFEQVASQYEKEIMQLSESKNEEIASLHQNENTLKGEITILEESLNQKALQLEDLGLKYNQNQEALRSLEEFHSVEISSASSQMEKMSKSLDEKTKENRKLQAQIKELESNLDRVTGESQSMKKDLSQTQKSTANKLSETEKKLEATLSSLKDANELLAKSYETVSELVPKLFEWKTQAFENAEKVALLSENLKISEAQLESVSAALFETENDLVSTEQVLASERETTNVLRDLLVNSFAPASLDVFEGVTQAAHDELLSKLIQEREGHCHSIDLLLESQQKSQAIESDLHFVRLNVNELEEELEKVEMIKKSLVDAVESQSELAESQWKQLGEQMKQVQVLELEGEGLQCELVVAKAQLDQANENLDLSIQERDQSIMDLQQNLTKLKSELDSKGDECSKLVHFVESLQKDIAISADNLEATCTELKERESQIEERNEIISCLQSELKDREMLMDQTAIQSSSLQKNLESSVSRKSEEIERLKAGIKEMENKLLDDTVSSAALNAKYLGKLEQCSKLESEIQNLDSKYHEKVAELSELAGLWEAEKSKISLLEKDLGQEKSLSEQNALKIASLTELKGSTEAAMKEERVSYRSDMESLKREHRLELNQIQEKLTETESCLESTNQELISVVQKAADDSHSAKLDVDNLKHQIDELMEKDESQETIIHDLKAKITLLSLEAEQSNLEKQEALESQEKLFNDMKYKLQSEKTEFMKENLAKQAELESKLGDLTDSLRIKDKEVEKLNVHSANLTNELARIQQTGKVEFSSLQQTILQLQEKISIDSAAYEQTVKEMSNRISEKTAKIHLFESKMLDCQNVINRAELKLSNETGRRDLTIKSLEAKLKDQKRELDRADAELKALRLDQEKYISEFEYNVAGKLEHQVEAATKELARRNAELERRLSEREDDELAFMQQIDKYVT